MEPNKFEAFTKALATRGSRRQALRRIGGILGGTALAGLFPGLALAGGGNSAAAHFCASVFGANTPAASQCTSDAAHHTGLFYNSSCGGGTQPVCCPQNPDGTCTSYSSATCCSGGQTCQSGACVTPTTTTTPAPCTGLGGPCTQNSQCCSFDTGGPYCAPFFGCSTNPPF